MVSRFPCPTIYTCHVSILNQDTDIFINLHIAAKLGLIYDEYVTADSSFAQCCLLLESLQSTFTLACLAGENWHLIHYPSLLSSKLSIKIGCSGSLQPVMKYVHCEQFLELNYVIKCLHYWCDQGSTRLKMLVTDSETEASIAELDNQRTESVQTDLRDKPHKEVSDLQLSVSSQKPPWVSFLFPCPAIPASGMTIL